jgi:hypothetical protein
MTRLPAVAFLFLLIVSAPAAADCVALAERLLEGEPISEEDRHDLGLFFPHLCRFVETDDRSFDALRDAASLTAFRERLKIATGADVFDFGERMLATFDAESTPSDPSVPLSTFESEHFVFVFPAGSPAAADIELIASSSEQIWRTIAEVLSVERDLEANRAVVIAMVDRGAGAARSSYSRKIPVHLHSHRSDQAASRIAEHSYGAAQLGATIVADDGSPAMAGTPLLVPRIDLLYFNPFSLVVLHHEIAHAVMLLGSFDSAALAGRQLDGERQLKKAFFAGYRKVPLFLHEAIGDYSFYYRGYYRVWPLLVGSPEEIIVSLDERGEYIPLKKLLKEGRRNRAKHHKSHSLQGAAFIHFLSETRGTDRMREWLLSGDSDGERSFRRVFGSSIESVEAEWRTWLRRAASAPSPPGEEKHEQSR